MHFLKRSLIAGLAASLLLAAPVWAQVSGSISGIVTDPDGAPLPGVSVTMESSLVPTSTAFTQANGSFRFPVLPPAADYRLTFQLQGFKTIVSDQIPVRVGGNSQQNLMMELSTVEETVTVTGTTPIVDVRSTTIQNNINEQYMQGVPSARDPWVMLEQTAGVQINKSNIGGSESGQQSTFTANGSRFSDNIWTYDGAEVTDVRANGASPMYYDFDAFEEISISTGGNDPSIQTGGIRINFVTKRGGNDWRASGRFYLTDGDLQACTVADRETGVFCEGTADDYFPGYIGNSINNIKDFGGEIGGPLVRDKFFVWGSYGKQNIKQFVGTASDDTQLTNWHAKGNAHIGDNLVLQYTFLRANKTKQGRGASATRPQATTWNQEGPSPVHTGKIQYTINDNNYIEGSINNTGLGFSLEPQGGRAVDSTRSLDTGIWGDTFFFFETERPLWNVRVDGNSYLAGSSIDHELKYGYSYRNAGVFSDSGIGTGIVRVYDDAANTVPAEAWLIQGQQDNVTGERNSFYAGDTISAGRLVINAGLRYDRQTSVMNGGFKAGNPALPGLFPDLTEPAFDPGFGWNSWSPRFGITYDLSGTGRTVLRLSLARYGSQMNAGQFEFNQTLGYREADLTWNDLNGNDRVDAGETGALLWQSSGWDPSDPLAVPQNTWEQFGNPWSDELILGVDHELSRSLAIGVDLVYKKNTNFNWSPRIGDIAADGNWVQESNSQCSGGITAGCNYYTRVNAVSPWTNTAERQDYKTEYKGATFSLTKRFANKWMGNFSFVYADPTQSFDSALAYTDPTNIAALNDESFTSFTRNGAAGGAARWHVKLSGMYQLPAGFSVAGFFQAREGFIRGVSPRSFNRPNGAGRAFPLTQEFGAFTLPTYVNLDLRAEKTFDLGQRGRIHIIADLFNTFNKGNILGDGTTQGLTTFDQIREVSQARVLRLGARLVLR